MAYLYRRMRISVCLWTGSLAAVLLCVAQGTPLRAQPLTAPARFHGLWNEVHPFELVLDASLQGYAHFPESGERIDLRGRVVPTGWQLLEVLPDGGIAGTWELEHADGGARVRWMNYDQTIGATCVLSKSPLPAPNLQIRLFQFRNPEGDWYFFISPAPPGKWRGIAWTTTRNDPWPVLGYRQGDQLLLDVGEAGRTSAWQLRFDYDRSFPRFGWWSDGQGLPEKVRFRHRKAVPIEVRRYSDFARDMLLLEPDLDWPGWMSFAARHLASSREAFRREYQSMRVDVTTRRPWQRQAVRLYAWVNWSFLRDDLLSGTLHITNTWEPPRQAPFIVAPGYAEPLSLRDIFGPGPLPAAVASLLPSASASPALELRPDGLYCLYGERSVLLPTALLKSTLAKGSPLYPYFGK